MTQKCKYCGNDNYRITQVYYGYSQSLVVVECSECKYEVIPVLVDRFAPERDSYAKCEQAWDRANSIPQSCVDASKQEVDTQIIAEMKSAKTQ